MVLTKAELIGSLQNEVRILLHLTSKIDRSKLDYRPSPKQRSTLELLRYLARMGPALVAAAIAGTFDMDAWTAAAKEADAKSFDQTLDVIRAQPEAYAKLLAPVPESVFREEVALFGPPTSKGAFIVNSVLCACAAYRTQLFLYLKACGREELNTMNLWGGIDPPPAP